MPVTIVGCPTVREADGLALSSRNARLSADERAAATVLSRALSAGCQAIAGGETRPEGVAAVMGAVVAAQPLARLDYAAAVDPEDLLAPASLDRLPSVRLLVAAQVGPVRLIDNCAAPLPSVAGTGAVGHNSANQWVDR
jgi:pantoate--beta-alanine ligase